MVTLLRKLFIKDYQDVERQDVRVKHGILAAVNGIVVNLLLIGLKLGLAIFMWSYSGILSLALVSDAVNNVTDLASGIVTLIGFFYAGKPADKEHPFGHQRIEYISGLILSVLVVAAGAELIFSSIEAIIAGTLVSYDLTGIIILAIAIVLKLYQLYVYLSLGKAVNSPSLKATSMDSLGDVVASVAMLASAICSYLLSWNFLDSYMGVAVGILVAYSGISMIKETSEPLVGSPISKTLIESIANDVREDKRILGVHDIMVHRYGPTLIFITLDVEMDENESFTEAHRLINQIEKKLEKKYHASVSIHCDPVAPNKPEVIEKKNQALELLKKLDPEASIHDFQIDGENVSFDVLTPYRGVHPKQEEIQKKMEELFEGSSVNIEFDHPYDGDPD